MSEQSGGELRREVGLVGAVLLGLGSILGTGVFVSVGLGVRLAGGWVVGALAVAGALAACNALSSAQLAAAHPVSGGTYEYGNRLLGPRAGFTAGWMFLLAKSASAATAALGFAGYALGLIGVDAGRWVFAAVAVGCVLAVTGCVMAGIRRSNVVNAGLVVVTLGALWVFVALAMVKGGGRAEEAAELPDAPSFLQACALMFVAYTGYGRIATLGEEVREPRKTIPRAIVVTILVTVLVYIAVALAGVLGAGVEAFGMSDAPLEDAARAMGSEGVALVVAVGACVAMLGVLLNLILGLSRVLLAMGRRGDMPGVFARVTGGSPVPAVLAVGAVIACLALIGDVKTTWSFSAFTVLVYYAITNACALRLPKEDRIYPRAIAWAGLVSCVGLAFWVEPVVWGVGLGLIGLGLVYHVVRARSVSRAASS